MALLRYGYLCAPAGRPKETIFSDGIRRCIRRLSLSRTPVYKFPLSMDHRCWWRAAIGGAADMGEWNIQTRLRFGGRGVVNTGWGVGALIY